MTCMQQRRRESEKIKRKTEERDRREDGRGPNFKEVAMIKSQERRIERG